MREKIKEKLKELKYSEHSIKSILSGRRKPRYETMIKLKHIVPIDAWINIKTYLRENEFKVNS